jgi:DNA transformation protein
VAARKSDAFLEYVQEQLRACGPVLCRPMFGGYGLYREGHFFGIVHGDRLYLKTDEASRAVYLAHGMAPFQPNARQTLRSYYEVPPDVLEEPATLAEWVETAVHASSGTPRVT